MTPLNPPIVPRKTYFGIWLILLLLLLLNWGLAQIDLGPFNLVATLAIAFVQMLLMLLYLMHVRYNTPLTRIFVAAGFIWLVIMFDLTLSDYLTRGSVSGTLRKSWEHGAWPVPAKEMPDRRSEPTAPFSR
jgi:cytochrome c oxidase subunit IV